MAISYYINKMVKKTTMLMMAIIMLPLLFAQTVKIYPTDDSFVRNHGSTARNTNYNGVDWKNNLRAGYEDSHGTDTSYLKFDLSDIQGTINSAVFSGHLVSQHDGPVVNLYSS